MDFYYLGYVSIIQEMTVLTHSNRLARKLFSNSCWLRTGNYCCSCGSRKIRPSSATVNQQHYKMTGALVIPLPSSPIITRYRSQSQDPRRQSTGARPHVRIPVTNQRRCTPVTIQWGNKLAGVVSHITIDPNCSAKWVSPPPGVSNNSHHQSMGAHIVNQQWHHRLMDVHVIPLPSTPKVICYRSRTQGGGECVTIQW